MDIGETEENELPEVIHTTVGDLIYAIAEAAEEATIKADDLTEITQLIFHGLVSRRKN